MVVLWAPASAPNEVFPILLHLLEAAAGVGDDSQECLADHHPGGLHCPNHLLVPGGGAGSRPSNGRLVVLPVGQVSTPAPHLTLEQLVLFAGDTTTDSAPTPKSVPHS